MCACLCVCVCVCFKSCLAVATKLAAVSDRRVGVADLVQYHDRRVMHQLTSFPEEHHVICVSAGSRTPW